MKSVMVNERAAAAAMEFAVGPQVRMVIENLYGVINSAMNDAYAKGVQDTLADLPAGYEEGRVGGYEQGYKDGVEVATGGEQPYPEFGSAFNQDPEAVANARPTEFYEGDSGDETDFEPGEDFGFAGQVNDVPDVVHSVDELPPLPRNAAVEAQRWIRDPATGNWVERPALHPFAWSPGWTEDRTDPVPLPMSQRLR